MRALQFDAERGDRPPRELTRYTVGRARLEEHAGAFRLLTEDAVEGVLADAQLDDYHGRGRNDLHWRPPVRLELRARWSHPSAELRGTTGFGFWNDPVDAAGRFVAAPNCLWFFHASPPSRLRVRGTGHGDGFVAGAMSGGSVGRPFLWAGNAALRVPGVGRLATRLGERRVGGGDVALPADLDLSAWHDYALAWTESGARFAIDDAEVAIFGRQELPVAPLGFVAWIDNNWASLEPNGSYRAGRLAVSGRQWLQVARMAITGDVLA